VASIELNDVVVPDDHILARGSGRRALTDAMLGERLLGPFATLGVLRHMTESALEFVLGREVMGAPLATHQHLQRRVVDLRMRTDLTAALARDAFARAVAGERYKALASELKLHAARQLMEASLECAQVMGSYGAQREAGLARAALDGLCATIAGGTEEAHRTVIFREMVREHQAAAAFRGEA
jgi:isovaleryl-CoA dehydrogenase